MANIALHGMENHLNSWIQTQEVWDKHGKKVGPRRKSRGLAVIRYADDFVILHKQKDIILQAKEEIGKWLKHLGLELKSAKTRISHTNIKHDGVAGFDFLGFNVRRYETGKYQKGKLKLDAKTLITPAKQSVKTHMRELKHILKADNAPVEMVIGRLSSVIRGWCNYYRACVAKQTFTYCRHRLFLKQWAWAKRKHPTRTKDWIYKKYFIKKDNMLVFGKADGKGKVIYVKPHNTYSIIRHTKVQTTRSVYDNDHVYWGRRLQERAVRTMSKTVCKLLRKQKGRCNICMTKLRIDDIIEVDHIVPKSQKGSDRYSNLQLVHGHCHDGKANNHTNTINPEEPYDGQPSSTVRE